MMLTNLIFLFRQKFLAVSTGYVVGRGNNGINQSTAQMHIEQRVTLTVCAIVSCFIITQVCYYFAFPLKLN